MTLKFLLPLNDKPYFYRMESVTYRGNCQAFTFPRGSSCVFQTSALRQMREGWGSSHTPF